MTEFRHINRVTLTH